MQSDNTRGNRAEPQLADEIKNDGIEGAYGDN